MINIGFSGTQLGMTGVQIHKLKLLLSVNSGPIRVHHGMCIGADDQFHQIVKTWQMDAQPVEFYGYPSDILDKTMHYKAADFDGIFRPRPPLERNADIVRYSDIMIFAPKSTTEQQRSGTWSTARLAREQGVDHWIIYPTGEVFASTLDKLTIPVDLGKDLTP